MTADELIDRLVADCEQPRDIVRDVFAALADVTTQELAAGRPVTIPGLGALRPLVRAGRLARLRVVWNLHPTLWAAVQAAWEQAKPSGRTRRPRT